MERSPAQGVLRGAKVRAFELVDGYALQRNSLATAIIVWLNAKKAARKPPELRNWQEIRFPCD